MFIHEQPFVKTYEQHSKADYNSKISSLTFRHRSYKTKIISKTNDRFFAKITLFASLPPRLKKKITPKDNTNA